MTFGALYVIQNPLRYFREEIKTLQEIEYQRIADLTFSEIKEAFYRQQIPWDQIAVKTSGSRFLLWKKPLSAPDPLGEVYRYWRISGKEKEEDDQNLYRYVTLEMVFAGHPSSDQELQKNQKENSRCFQYKFVVKRIH